MSGKKKSEAPEEIKYYSLGPILKEQAHYNIIFGERSNGKTYAALQYGLERYCKSGEQTAIVRRYDDDIKAGKADSFYDALVASGEVSRLSGGQYNAVRYRNRRFYLAYLDNDTETFVTDNRPFAMTFAINTADRYKSTSYPGVTTIVFDEFLTRDYYLRNEFADFMSIVSTIVRTRDNVKIFMLGNTVNQSCPYFTEMGLKHIREQKQGSIEVYTYGNKAGKVKLKVAVEYAANLNVEKPSNVYFAFDNPKLQMITGGVWEMAMYPHLPVKYLPRQVVFTYFIAFEGELLQCEIVSTGTAVFTYIHRKTTPLQNPDKDIVFTLEYSEKPNFVRRLTKPVAPWHKKIAKFFLEEKVFYQDNAVGEIVRNYLNASARDKIT